MFDFMQQTARKYARKALAELTGAAAEADQLDMLGFNVSAVAYVLRQRKVPKCKWVVEYKRANLSNEIYTKAELKAIEQLARNYDTKVYVKRGAGDSTIVVEYPIGDCDCDIQDFRLSMVSPPYKGRQAIFTKILIFQLRNASI